MGVLQNWNMLLDYWTKYKKPPVEALQYVTCCVFCFESFPFRDVQYATQFSINLVTLRRVVLSVAKNLYDCLRDPSLPLRVTRLSA